MARWGPHLRVRWSPELPLGQVEPIVASTWTHTSGAISAHFQLNWASEMPGQGSLLGSQWSGHCQH